MLAKPVLAITLSAALAGACPSAPGSRNVECRPLTANAPGPSADSPFKGTVFTIVMENHSAGQIFGNPEAAYINKLANEYAVARGYHNPLIHPSEPNYLWMIAGQNFGVTDDGSPYDNHVACTSHVCDQIEKVGLDWRGYMESMGKPCNPDTNGLYKPKHNPFVYFDDIFGWKAGTQPERSARCIEHVVDYSQMATDMAAGKLPRYVFITPNMVNDMHDGSIGDGDRWLAREVPKILASPEFQNGGVLFLTWDEGEGADYDAPMIVVSPLAKKGYVSQVEYDTSSYLKTVQTILGLEALPCDPAPDSVQTMDDLFTVPLR